MLSKPSSQNRFEAIAREIRTPAGVTWSALDEVAVALGSKPACDDAKMQEVIAMARLGVKRLLRLADRLEMIAELEAGTLELHRYRVDLRDVIGEAADQATYLAGRKAIVSSRTIPERSAIVNVDARWVGAAILEVCGNAFRFARSEIRVVLLHADPLVILVEDDGPGFLSDKAQRGAGLGTSLAMAKHVFEAHGGKLHQRVSTLPVRGGGDRPGAAIHMELPFVAAAS